MTAAHEKDNGQLGWEDRRDMAAEDTFARDDESAHKENRAKTQFLEALKKNPDLLISTAGSSFDGYTIAEYLDTISTDGMVGSGIPSAVDAVAADLTGQRSMELARKMGRAKRIAWEELLWRAHQLGADGVVGVRYDVYMPYAGLFGASVTATAVTLDFIDPDDA